MIGIMSFWTEQATADLEAACHRFLSGCQKRELADVHSETERILHNNTGNRRAGGKASAAAAHGRRSMPRPRRVGRLPFELDNG